MTDLATLKLHGGSIFASTDFIRKFLADGSLPKIHDAMGKVMAMVPPEERAGAIDFGACHGFLSIRARKMGYHPVVGLEADQKSVDVFNEFLRPQVQGVNLICNRLDVRSDDFARFMREVCRDSGVTTILARRVLSELFCTTYGKAAMKDETIWRAAGQAFSRAVIDAGIKRIILQGRLYGPFKNRATHPIYNTDREIEALGPLWNVAIREGDVALLTPK